MSITVPLEDATNTNTSPTASDTNISQSQNNIDTVGHSSTPATGASNHSMRRGRKKRRNRQGENDSAVTNGGPVDVATSVEATTSDEPAASVEAESPVIVEEEAAANGQVCIRISITAKSAFYQKFFCVYTL